MTTNFFLINRKIFRICVHLTKTLYTFIGSEIGLEIQENFSNVQA